MSCECGTPSGLHDVACPRHPSNQPLADAELIAVAALAQCDVASMQAENAARREAGAATAYSHFQTDATCRLDRELRRRGIL